MEEFSEFIGIFLDAEIFVEKWRISEDKLCFETNFTVFTFEMIFWGYF
jgi:hypothetical protein